MDGRGGKEREKERRREGGREGPVTTVKYKQISLPDTPTKRKEAKPFDHRGFQAHVWDGINLLHPNLES